MSSRSPSARPPTPTNGGARTRRIGAVVAIGVGALILGSVLAQTSHRDRIARCGTSLRHRHSHPART
jgi:hypothetical protein